MTHATLSRRVLPLVFALSLGASSCKTSEAASGADAACGAAGQSCAGGVVCCAGLTCDPSAREGNRGCRCRSR